MSLTGKKIGQIRIDTLIANGGMGDVYRGFDETLERRVAVKALNDEHCLRREARARFLSEARILSRLNHPGICQIYGLVERPEAELLVLEYIEGATLRELGAENLDDSQRLAIALTVAEVLEAAHREGIVHRDLKPDNIMITPERQVKILDFGIAHHVASAERRRHPDPQEMLEVAARPGSPARHEAVVGTVAYMSPEQARQCEVTSASDMFTFGLVLQELFTGKRAYPRMPVGALLLKVSRGETAPVAGLDRRLARLIEELKHPDPDRRPTASAARQRLLEIRGRPARERRRRKRLAFAAAAIFVLGSLVTAYSARREARRPAVEDRRSLAAEAGRAGRRLATASAPLDAWIVLAGVHRGLAELALVAAADPTDHLRAARAAVDRVLAHDPENVEAWAERGRIAAAEARFAARRGEDAEEAWVRAERAFARVRELDPGWDKTEHARVRGQVVSSE